MKYLVVSIYFRIFVNIINKTLSIMTETNHYATERMTRAQLIANVIKDTNKVLCINVLDRGHKNGAERFELTDKAIIKTYNDKTNRHITDLIARPNQIYNRLGNAFLALPEATRNKVLKLAREHQRKGYNSV